VSFVIATAWGTLGDTLPFIAVGAELRRRGHEVALVSSPAFERQAHEAALDLVPVGTLDEHQAFVRDPALWDRDTVVKAVSRYCGVGTIAHALAAGIPQVVLPIVGEQFDLGYRVERLGVGRMLTPTTLTAARLKRELESLLSSERVRARCLHFRDEVGRASGGSLAAGWIEEWMAAQALPRAPAR
jgi:UDP:flavonoid glycosyltransferase YjiC (YdhE family)